MDSQRFSIFCDFDGTISLQDVTDLLLERLADPEWHQIEEEWVAGKIGSRECMARQVPLIRGGWKAIEEALEDVTIDETFHEFVRWSEAHKYPLAVVSDGLDAVIKMVLLRNGLSIGTIIANRLQYDKEHGFSLSQSLATAGKYQGCSSGVCKCMVLARAPSRPVKVVIGDGKSDFCWSERADMLFAKKSLLQYATEKKLNPYAFKNFNDIQAILEEASRRVPERVQEISSALIG